MYKIKKVIQKSEGQTDKLYHKMLFDRVFSLHGMLKKRVIKIDEYNKKIASIEAEIRTLEKRIQHVVKDIDKEKMDIPKFNKKLMPIGLKSNLLKEKMPYYMNLLLI